jgi:hypothetical protein
MTQSTTTQKNRTFKTAKGTACTVWSVKVVAQRGPWTGLAETVRTFVTAEGRTGEVDVEPGCSFKAEAAVAAAGW